MNRFINILTVLFYFLSAGYALSKEPLSFANSPEFIEIKAKTEELISKRYRDQLSTQLDTESFNVNVSVVLVEKKQIKKPLPPPIASVTPTPLATPKPTVETDKNLKAENKNVEMFLGPEDITTGVVTLLPLLNEYQKELAALREEIKASQKKSETIIIQAPAPQVSTTVATSPVEEKEQLIERLEIKSVQVLLGLAPGISSSYKRDIEDWLRNAVTSDFGKSGTYQISTIRKILKLEPPPKVLSPMDKISNFQILLGFMVLAGVLFLGFFAHKVILSKDVREQTKTALRIQEMKAALQAAKNRDVLNPIITPIKEESDSPSSREGSNNSAPTIDVTFQSYRELQMKIVALSPKMKAPSKNLFDFWFDQKIDGRFKAATYIDSILGNQSTPVSKDLVSLPETVLLPDNWLKDLDFHQVFREFPSLTLQEKSVYLDQVYWDMLSMNLLGNKASRAPFDTLADLSNEAINQVLQSQDPRIKSMALLHLPSEKVQNYLNELPEGEKQGIIENVLQLQRVSIADYETASDLIAKTAKKAELPQGFVQLTDQMPNVLFSLSAREELNMLPQSFAKLPDQGLNLKKSHPSLAFLFEWPDEQLKTLFESAEVRWIATYLFLLPSMTKRILPMLPDRTSLIVRQELGAKRAMHPKLIEKNMSEFKLFLNDRIRRGQFDLEEIFSKSRTDSSANQGVRLVS